MGLPRSGILVAAPGSCVRPDRSDLAGVVGSFLRSMPGRILAQLSPRGGISGSRACHAQQAFGWLPSGVIGPG